MSETGKFKIVILGNSGVGKTALIEAISNGCFSDIHVPTVGAQYVSLDIECNKKHITMELWDTAGQEVFRSLVGFYARGAMGAFLVTDITTSNAVDDLGKWMHLIDDQCPEAKTILFANKLDLADQRAVSEEDLMELAEKHHYYYIEGSAKTRQSVEDAFLKMVEMVSAEVEIKTYESVAISEKRGRCGCC